MHKHTIATMETPTYSKTHTDIVSQTSAKSKSDEIWKLLIHRFIEGIHECMPVLNAISSEYQKIHASN